VNVPDLHEITSPENPTYKQWRRLLAPGGVKRGERALVSGAKVVAEAFRAFPERAEAWIVAGREMPPAPPGSSLPSFRLAPELFAALDVFGTRSPLLVLRPPEIARWEPDHGLPDGLSLFVPFQDPENVGGVIRSAAAFGVARVILLAGSAHPYHPKSLRASAGAVLRAPLAAGPRLVDLPSTLPLVPLSAEGKPLSPEAFPPVCALLPGLEGPGLPEAWRGRAVSVPHRREVESLNAAAAVAIALYVWSQRPASGPRGTSGARRGAQPRSRR
jgi:tRNA G18 (ribose-2'-O)-methylase SpoU